ncbi:MAG: hypothetical protein AAF741_16990 [Bacteroidota bacterium]
MRARLKATAQRWKSNALRSTKKSRLLRARLRRSQNRVAQLEYELKVLREQYSPLRVANHCYPAQLIALAVFIVVHANGSLRCAAKTVGFMARLLDWPCPTPSHTSVRRWVLRSGLYQLEHAAHRAGNYVALLDESIQIGREKLLLMLGVKIEHDRSHCRPLAGRDVVVLGLEVQPSWTGEAVADFVRRNLKKMPQINILYFITDGGTNLAKALKILGLDVVCDCTHIMMNAVKRSLSDDPVLSQLCTDIGRIRRQLMLTAEGFLLPPSLRDKDRFLRIFTIVDWVERIDSMWAKLPQSSRQKLDFIHKARPRIRCMDQLKILVEITAGVLKGAGLSPVSQKRWERLILQFRSKNKLTKEAEDFIQAMRSYFSNHQAIMAKHARLLCCTDIIESTFGRYKNKGGTPTISADALAIALYGCEITPQLIQKALSKVPYKAVHHWEEQHVCDNRYSLVRRMNRELKSGAA